MRKEKNSYCPVCTLFLFDVKKCLFCFHPVTQLGKRKFLVLNMQSLIRISALKSFQFLEITHIPLVSHYPLQHVYNTTLAPCIKCYNKQLQNFRMHFCQYWYWAYRHEKSFQKLLKTYTPRTKVTKALFLTS